MCEVDTCGREEADTYSCEVDEICKQFEGRTWMIHTTDAENDTDDKISDTTAGVVIMIFERMVDKVLDKGHVTYGMNLTNIIKIHSLKDIYTMYASDHNTKILCEYIQKVIEYKIRSIVVLCLFIYIIF